MLEPLDGSTPSKLQIQLRILMQYEVFCNIAFQLISNGREVSACLREDNSTLLVIRTQSDGACLANAVYETLFSKCCLANAV